IDDQGCVREAFRRLLGAAGFGGGLFSGGAEFLSSLDSLRPNCILLDLHMPGMSGYEVQTHLARINSAIPIVVLTGNDTPEARKRTLGAGASAYLTKPVDRNDLLQAVKSAIVGNGGAKNLS